jgi:hypothetical protein
MSVYESASVVAARQLAAEAREARSARMPGDLADRVARRRAQRLLETAGAVAQI